MIGSRDIEGTEAALRQAFSLHEFPRTDRAEERRYAKEQLQILESCIRRLAGLREEVSQRIENGFLQDRRAMLRALHELQLFLTANDWKDTQWIHQHVRGMAAAFSVARQATQREIALFLQTLERSESLRKQRSRSYTPLPVRLLNVREMSSLGKKLAKIAARVPIREWDATGFYTKHPDAPPDMDRPEAETWLENRDGL